MIGIGTKVRVVPIGMREIQRDAQTAFSAGRAKLLHNIPAEGRLHDRISQIAILYGRPSRRVPANPLPDARARVEHRQALVMLGGEGKHPHAVVGEERGPRIGVEPGWVPALVQFVVAGSFRVAQIEKRPGLMSQAGNRVKAPVNTHAVLHVEKGFVGGRRSPMISRLGYLFYIRPHPAVVRVTRRQMMRRFFHGERPLGG